MIYLIGIGCVALALSHYGFYRWGKAVARREYAEAQAQNAENNAAIAAKPSVDFPFSGMRPRK